MKNIKNILLIQIAVLLFTSTVFAITPDEAYERELKYLESQKASLLSMKKQLEKSYQSKKNDAKIELKNKESKFSNLQLSNGLLVEEFKTLEKLTKESSELKGQIEKIANKSASSIDEIVVRLGLNNLEDKSVDPITLLQGNFNKILNILNTFSESKWRGHAFLNEKEELVQGEVRFNGLASAWGKYNGKVYSLVPFNKDYLKVVPETNSSSLYLFSPDFSKVKLITTKSWKESFADMVPGFVMFLIMISVLSLFVMLARS